MLRRIYNIKRQGKLYEDALFRTGAWFKPKDWAGAYRRGEKEGVGIRDSILIWCEVCICACMSVYMCVCLYLCVHGLFYYYGLRN